MFTVAEFQLNSASLGEGELGRSQKNLGLFLEGKRGNSGTEVGTGKDQYCRHFALLGFVFVSVR